MLLDVQIGEHAVYDGIGQRARADRCREFGLGNVAAAIGLQFMSRAQPVSSMNVVRSSTLRVHRCRQSELAAQIRREVGHLIQLMLVRTRSTLLGRVADRDSCRASETLPERS